MLIEKTFAKDIFRPIDPVVRADENKYLANELEEFVITGEVEHHLLEFFEAYNDPGSVGNGAWISGFFGSGKSHLLKMLAVMLEDRTVDGKPAMDYILPKVENASLHAAMEVARSRHPSESILFDIDHIAPNEGRSETGALLSAFIRAFNMHCGYYDGDQQFIAQLEWDLDRLGKLDEFRTLARDKYHMDWNLVRKIAPTKAKQITAAYDEVCGNEPGTSSNIIDYYRNTYHPSIRSFAERVRDYIDDKGRGFRLNFFVDEVGLFIARNSRLMVNLQSVAEELNTICRGNSWIVVTSQEAMEGIVAEMSNASGEDFTKIQARFDLKMPLTSADAKTVIKDRLLAKSPDTEAEYLALYERHKDDFGVLFDFSDGAKRYNQWPDFDDFLGTYPFVPYQFEVFMTAMRELSRKDAFTGKHNSTGARSMLGVFQDVAQELCREDASTEQGSLAPFDLMFEGLRNSFRGEFYAAIGQAERNIGKQNPLTVRVLKALLLVKYCRDFRATPGNIRVLLYGSFAQRPAELEAEVKEAIDELERQLYVRRNGNEYEYLTDEEKEVESDIRNTPVSESEIKKTIASLFTDEFGTTKVTYKNGSFQHAYSLNLKVDGEGQGTQRNDLTIDLVTDFSEEGLLVPVVPTPPKTLSVRFMDAADFLRGVRTHIQTERYTNLSSGAGEVREAIISDKRQANRKLYQQLKARMRDILTHASYNAGGVEITDHVSGTGREACATAALELVRRSYPMLQQVTQTITDSQVYQEAISVQMGAILPEYCDTVLNRIGALSSMGTVTVAGDGPRSLTTVFTKNEFGWPEVVVRSAVARLFASNRIELRRTGKPLDASVAAQALQKRQDLDKVSVERLDAVSPEELAALKYAMRTLMANMPVVDDPKSLAAELHDFAEQQANTYRQTLAATRPYPFHERYQEKLDKIEDLAQQSAEWRWVLTAFPAKAVELRDTNKDLSSMAKFAKGSSMQKNYDKLRVFEQTEAAEALALGIDEEVITQIRDTLAAEDCYKTSGIVQAIRAMTNARTQMQKALKSLRDEARAAIESIRHSYEQNYDLSTVDQERLTQFRAIFDSYLDRVDHASTKAEVQGLPNELQRRETANIVALVAPTPTPPGPSVDDPKVDPPVPPKTVSARSLVPKGWSKPVLSSPDDARAYADGLYEAIVAAIEAGEIVYS